MAVAKLGAVITDLAGSIGGTTFRRSSSSLIVTNRNRGTEKQQLRNNEALGRLRSYSNDYAKLSKAQISAWASAGNNLKYTDRFGNQQNYRPRELYMAVRSGLEGTGRGVPDPANIDQIVPTPIILGFTLSRGGNCEVILNSTHQNNWAIFQIDLLAKQSIYTTDKRFKKIAVINAGVNNTYDISNEVQANYLLPLRNPRARIYVSYVNQWGMRSEKVSSLTDITL